MENNYKRAAMRSCVQLLFLILTGVRFYINIINEISLTLAFNSKKDVSIFNFFSIIIMAFMKNCFINYCILRADLALSPFSKIEKS